MKGRPISHQVEVKEEAQWFEAAEAEARLVCFAKYSNGFIICFVFF